MHHMPHGEIGLEHPKSQRDDCSNGMLEQTVTLWVFIKIIDLQCNASQREDVCYGLTGLPVEMVWK